ncbi:beta-ketoacyl synthase [Parapedobacter defluvii]|uniref:Beta-ketoacyl synthase n=1 Tax=Parapedobacter defluvii TaxID=2045106 RepID=A0ABQ1L3V3_9SPHI|nr:beta-ketoacyl synthase N-terminal-like domain-containing protein [Parapedobacter defluvii]GGC16514.1 beta-ketoacyl synthase [Parapedobacter defluvii]
MKTDVFISGDCIISPLGMGSKLNFEQLLTGETAIAPVDDATLADHRIHAARIADHQWIGKIRNASGYTRLETLFILAIQQLIDAHSIPVDRRTLVLLSTTKGNVSLLHNPEAQFPENRIYLAEMAHAIQHYFGFANAPITISNACISGALALSVARQLLQYSDTYDQALVVGGDEISKFIVSGFEAFQALSDGRCRPFDRDRNGLNLGEAIAAAYVTKKATDDAVRIKAAASFNDANHISGPSRTGEGLYRSIREAMQLAGEPMLDFISAHGTATVYNDEMEAIALHRAGLSDTPLHSLKAYYGHTLGASGLLETILGIHSLRANRLIPSLGFQHTGTSKPLNLITQPTERPLGTFLKTASGFGGCNIAMIFEKV